MCDYGAVSTDISLLASAQLGSSSQHIETESEAPRGMDIDSGTDRVEDGDTIDFIWADPGCCCYALYSKLNPEKVLLKQSPLALAKALKVIHACPTIELV